MKYKLLALDVDRTLVGPDNAVPDETSRAVRRANAAGLRICLATGRSYIETMPIWRQLALAGPHEPLVLVGGSIISEPDTGRTIYSRGIERDLACSFAEALAEEGLSAMAIVDAWRHGVDYYLAESADSSSTQRDWFGKMNVRVRRFRRLGDAVDMPEPLRVSAVVAEEAAAPIVDRLSRRFDGRLNVHSIFAPNYGVTIVEAFAAGVDKFAAIRHIAQGHGISPGRIVAVGDDVNDVTMICGAGLGVVMPHADESLRRLAAAVAEPSLPAFLARIVRGEFD
ncbi:MAG: HAD family hydrolase [Planctomycetota bacterium]|jgi:Cof subfamily protein (haloacid dehalogenase superfamily)